MSALINERTIAQLTKIVGKDKLLEYEPMSLHTSFKIGGDARAFVSPETEAELLGVLALCHELELEYFVLGCGSNLLVSDAGFDGVVISLARFTTIERAGNTLVCGAGATLKAVSDFACEQSLGGFEFASGIPGSVGGACFMNAGAYDGSISDVLASCRVLESSGACTNYAQDALELGYRTSKIAREQMVVISASFELYEKEQSAIQSRIDELTAKRAEKQPLELPSAGSTFKRPRGYFAGKLISDSGLRGFRVGDAAVSEKHAGFVVNLGAATAADVRGVIAHVRAEVEQRFGVLLEPELRFLGNFSDDFSF